jgi:hypothetical protein
VALNHTNTGADQRKSWARTPALTRTTRGPLESEYSSADLADEQSITLRVLPSIATSCRGLSDYLISADAELLRRFV